MAPKDIRRIGLENLLIDLQNPRYDILVNQREALATIAQQQGAKLINLATDIVDKGGLNPSELPIVTPTDDESTFVVVEGNRRIAALKLILIPTLLNSLGLPKNLLNRYKDLHALATSSFSLEYDCVVLDRQDANHWILLKHTGENEGVGIVTWDGRARQRFRGSSPALQAIEMVEASNLLDEETKKKLSNIYITNVERLLNTPDARKLLGVVIKNKQLILQDPEESLARLALVVSDVANRNIKVTDLDSKEQRINYAQRIAEQPLRVSGESTPSAPAATESEQPTTTPVPPTGTSLSISSSSATPSIRKISPNRNTLIPKNLKLTIPQNRINKIYFELQKLNINDFINSCAVMCRVFIELSVDDFAKRQSITLYDSSKNRPFSLRDKINAVADYLEANKTCSKSELYGVRTLVMKNGHVLSVDSLNAYVHNRNYSPAASDLKANWDSLEIFVKALWS